MSNPALEFTLVDEASSETPHIGALSAAVYGRMLKALLPPGRLWKRDPTGILSLLLLACADELERVDGRAWDLIEEADPRTATELLEDYERVLGLPSTGTDAERRNAISARLVRRQRFRPVDFQVALASTLGQDADDVVVLERTAAWAASVDDEAEIFRFFIYRDPVLPGAYDVAAAQSIVDLMKPSHTEGYVIESVGMLCDDEFSLCDRDLLGV